MDRNTAAKIPSTLAEKWGALGDWSPLSALARVAKTKWLIDGVIPSGSINWMVAAPSSFKTFLALDMAACIASGRAWHGRQTDEAIVLYIASEGDDDIHVRRAAGDIEAGDTGPLCIAQARPRLDEPHGMLALMVMAQAAGFGLFQWPEVSGQYDIPEKYMTPEQLEEPRFMDDGLSTDLAWSTFRPQFAPADAVIADFRNAVSYPGPAGRRTNPKSLFVVLDTYSQTSADDTKATVSRYIKTLRSFQDRAAAIGCTVTVLVVDHTTKSGESYMGSLAKEGDSDTMIEVDRRGNSHAVTLKSAKMRGGAPFEPIHLEMKPVTLDGFVDALGRPLTSLSVVDGEHGHKMRKASGSEGDTAAALVVNLLHKCRTHTTDTLRLQFITHRTNEGKKPDTVARSYRRAFDYLLSDDLIIVGQDNIVSLAENALQGA